MPEVGALVRVEVLLALVAPDRAKVLPAPVAAGEPVQVPAVALRSLPATPAGARKMIVVNVIFSTYSPFSPAYGVSIIAEHDRPRCMGLPYAPIE